MAYFDYYCDKCEKQFEIQCGMSDDRSNVSCTECGGHDVRRVFTSIVMAKKSGGSSVTVGGGGGSSCSSCASKNCGSCH